MKEGLDRHQVRLDNINLLISYGLFKDGNLNKVTFFFLSAKTQLASFSITNFSLILGSCKLYYFQRLGHYSDHEPSLKMILFASFPMMFLVFGILLSLVLISTYYQLWVLAVIFFSSFVHCICLKAVYRKKSASENIIKKLYNNKKEYGSNETSNIFWMSVLTSWVAPCTVWTNNFAIKTRFLFFSSLITIAVNLLSILVVYILVITVGLMDNVNPPITHCYQTIDIFNSTNYQFTFQVNDPTPRLFICEHDCMPVINKCSGNGGLLENYDFLFCIFVIVLLLLSLGASVCLQFLASNFQMHKLQMQRLTYLCPKIFYNFLFDFVNNHEQLEQEKQEKLLNLIKETVKKHPQLEESIQKVLLLISRKTEMSEELEKLLTGVQMVKPRLTRIIRNWSKNCLGLPKSD